MYKKYEKFNAVCTTFFFPLHWGSPKNMETGNMCAQELRMGMAR